MGAWVWGFVVVLVVAVANDCQCCVVLAVFVSVVVVAAFVLFSVALNGLVLSTDCRSCCFGCVTD